MAHDIFISYGHEDKSTADAACAVLESEGLRCWIAPRDILPGNEWTMSVMDGIVHAKAVVLIFSHHSDASPQVRREVERAIHHGIPVVPVRIEDVLPSEAMEYLISAPHWLDAMTAPLESHYRRLAASLKLLIQQQGGTKLSEEVSAPETSRPKSLPRTSKLPRRAMLAIAASLLLLAGIYGGSQLAHRSTNTEAIAKPSQSPLPPVSPEILQSPPQLMSPSAAAVSASSEPTPPAQAQLSNQPVDSGAIITNSIGMKFVKIKPGTFMMGSPPDEDGHSDNETLHRVTLTKGFYMGQTDVTIAQFEIFVNDSGYQTGAEISGTAVQWTGQTWAQVPGGSWHNPGFGQDGDYPVVDVNWNDAVAFCTWISRKEGKRYRLPTEAEWEYCARAATTTAYQWGNNPDDGNGWGNFKDLPWLMQYPMLPAFSWSDGYKFTSPVAKFRPNAWNLYDMPGDVLNWCSDWYSENADGDVTDPQGPTKDGAPSVTNPFWSFYHGPCRVVRGGSWAGDPHGVRSAARGFAPSIAACSPQGFRLVLESQ